MKASFPLTTSRRSLISMRTCTQYPRRTLFNPRPSLIEQTIHRRVNEPLHYRTSRAVNKLCLCNHFSVIFLSKAVHLHSYTLSRSFQCHKIKILLPIINESLNGTELWSLLRQTIEPTVGIGENLHLYEIKSDGSVEGEVRA